MSLQGDDCYFYYYSECTKGDACPFRHSPAALGNETVCTLWKAGQCNRQICKFRHMDIKKDRSSIPCYWETQPGGCTKPHCVFFHSKPKYGSSMAAPQPPQSQRLTRGGSFKQLQSTGDPVKLRLNLSAEAQEVDNPSPKVEPVVVNPFDEESDQESTTSSPSKAGSVTHQPTGRIATAKIASKTKELTTDFGIKSLQDIRQEKLLAQAKMMLEEADEVLTASRNQGTGGSQLQKEVEEDQRNIGLKKQVPVSVGRAVRPRDPEPIVRRVVVSDDKGSDKPAPVPSVLQRLGRKVSQSSLESPPAVPPTEAKAQTGKTQTDESPAEEDKSVDKIQIKSLSQIRKEKQKQAKNIPTGIKINVSSSEGTKVKVSVDKTLKRTLPGIKRGASAEQAEAMGEDGGVAKKTRVSPRKVQKMERQIYQPPQAKQKDGDATGITSVRQRLGLNQDATKNTSVHQRLGVNPDTARTAIQQRIGIRKPEQTPESEDATEKKNVSKKTQGWGVMTFSEIMAEKRKRKLEEKKGVASKSSDNQEDVSTSPKQRRTFKPIVFDIDSSDTSTTKSTSSQKPKRTPIVYDVTDSDQGANLENKIQNIKPKANGQQERLANTRQNLAKRTPIVFDLDNGEEKNVESQPATKQPKKAFTPITFNKNELDDTTSQQNVSNQVTPDEDGQGQPVTRKPGPLPSTSRLNSRKRSLSSSPTKQQPSVASLKSTVIVSQQSGLQDPVTSSDAVEPSIVVAKTTQRRRSSVLSRGSSDSGAPSRTPQTRRSISRESKVSTSGSARKASVSSSKAVEGEDESFLDDELDNLLGELGDVEEPERPEDSKDEDDLLLEMEELLA